MSLVEVKNISKKYGNHFALKDLSLEFEAKKQYAILGASGCGKSTLLYLLGGLDRPDSGEVCVDGLSLSSLSDEKLANYRNNNVGFIFQFHFLLPSVNCLKNILLPGEIGGHKIGPIKKRSLELADHLGITHCLNKFPYQLSGGEQQRVNIVRALSLRPKLLLCDEPTGNLDSENSAKVTVLLQKLAGDFGSTLAVVTHDRSVSDKFENNFILRDGQLLEQRLASRENPVPPPPPEN
jgi:ABC-type lipoprotein export system ATPase subunit